MRLFTNEPTLWKNLLAALTVSLALLALLGCGFLRRGAPPTATPETAVQVPAGISSTVTAIAAKPTTAPTAAAKAPTAAPTAASKAPTATVAAKVPAGFKQFKSSTYPYSVLYPSSWTAKDAGVKTSEVTADAFMSGKKSVISKTQTFEGNINIMSEEMPDGTTLDDYLEANIQNIADQLGEDPDWSEGPEIAGEPSYWIGYMMPGDNYDVYIDQFVFVAGGRGWLFTLASLPDDEEDFMPSLEKMAETFKLEQ